MTAAKVLLLLNLRFVFFGLHDVSAYKEDLDRLPFLKVKDPFEIEQPPPISENDPVVKKGNQMVERIHEKVEVCLRINCEDYENDDYPESLINFLDCVEMCGNEPSVLQLEKEFRQDELVYPRWRDYMSQMKKSEIATLPMYVQRLMELNVGTFDVLPK